ncbi:MAG: response regulator [Crocinitomicaceae bacterium]|nr:response regulator [Crocinitomicaceae bacterium]
MKKNILLLDDDEDDQLIFASTIESNFNAYEFVGFSQYTDALAFLEKYIEETPVLFLDLNMPKTNGLEILKELRKNDKFEHLKILIYSTSNNPKDINDCLIAGANAFITKPSRINDLILEITPYLENQSIVQ